MRVPTWAMPPLMSNHGNYIVSMGRVCAWLAEQAEALGVEIFPGMSCSEIVWDGDRVAGVVAGEFGREPDGTPGPGYEPGMELRGKYVMLAEGVRGCLSQQVIARFGLDAGSDVQKYGLGMKEIWEVDPAKHREGTVVHTMGWPLGRNAGGGSFIYHAEDNKVYVGFVVHLNYANPYVYPYMEFQRFKHHPMVASCWRAASASPTAARAISEGGFQSMPKAAFPGGVLLGCSVGLVNVPRIKGNHNAMLSGKAAAEAAQAAIAAGRAGDTLDDYDAELAAGPVGRDLRRVRNVKPLWSRLRPLGLAGRGRLRHVAAEPDRLSLFGTLRHGKTDAEATGEAKDYQPIDYPKPDGKLSFDRLTNVSFSMTNHEESQPCHLKLVDPGPAGAREPADLRRPVAALLPGRGLRVVPEGDGQRFQINFQNCVHCKTCDIKDPCQNIVWTVPQGGDGPNYPGM